MANKPQAFERWPSSLGVPYGPYRAVVQRVVDGDTLIVETSPGFNVYTCESIRVKGINAPEMFSGTLEEKAKGREAKAYAEELLPVGAPIVLTTDKDRTTFGRYVASIQMEDGRDFGQTMIEGGHAVVSEWR